jgi:hypothetical protein
LGDVAASQVFQLDPALIDEIAERVGAVIVERVIEAMRAEGVMPQAPVTTAWLDAQEVARQLRVSREWVYEHADELGASRIGSGPRPRLRFPPQILDSRRSHHAAAEAASQPTKTRRKPGGLIPIHAP